MSLALSPTQIDSISTALETMANSAGMITSELKNLIITQAKVSTSFSHLLSNIKNEISLIASQITLEKKLTIEKQKLQDVYNRLSIEMLRGSKINKATAEDYKKQLIATSELTKKINDLTKIEKQLAEAAEFSAKSFKDKTQSILDSTVKTTSAITKFTSSMGGIGTAFGGSALSIKSATDSMVKYNNSLFTLNRTQQIFGQRSEESWSDIYDSIKDTTVFGKNELIGLQNTFNSSILGTKPSTQEFLKMQGQIVKAFGNNKEAAATSIKDIASMQSKLPQMYDLVQEGLKLAESGGNDDRLKQIQNQIVLMGDAYGLADQQVQTLLQSVTKVDAKQEKLAKPAKAQADATKSWENLTLAAGQSVEEEFISISKAVTMMNEELEKSPRILKGIMGAELGTNLLGGLSQAITSIGGLSQAYGALKLIQGESVIGSLQSASAFGKIAQSVGMFGAASATAFLAWEAGQGIFDRFWKSTPEEFANNVNDALEGTNGWISKSANSLANALNSVLGSKNESNTDKDKLDREQKARNEFEKKDKKKQELQKKEKENAKDITKEIKKSTDLTEEQNKINISNANSLKEQMDNLKLIVARNEANLNFVNQLSSSWAGQIATLKEIGGLTKTDLFQNVVLTNNALKTSKKNLEDVTEQLNIASKIAFGNSIDLSNMDEFLKKLDSIEDSNAITSLTSALQKFQAAQIQATAAQKASQDARIALATKEEDMAIEYNNIQRERVDSEQEMVAATALGATQSMSLLKEQFDLSKQSEQLGKQKLEQLSKSLFLINNNGKQQEVFTKQELDGLLKITDSRMQKQVAQEMLSKKGFKLGSESMKQQLENVYTYGATYNKIQKEINAKTLDMLNLTKKLREGYLSAIEAMTIGFGEFSEIIPTQSMGVYQIAQQVNKSQGANVGNVMPLGGAVGKKSRAYTVMQNTSGEQTTAGRTGRAKEDVGTIVGEMRSVEKILNVPGSATAPGVSTSTLPAIEAKNAGISTSNGTTINSAKDFINNATPVSKSIDKQTEIMKSQVEFSEKLVNANTKATETYDKNTIAIDTTNRSVNLLITSLDNLNNTIKGLKINQGGVSSGSGGSTPVTPANIVPGTITPSGELTPEQKSVLEENKRAEEKRNKDNEEIKRKKEQETKVEPQAPNFPATPAVTEPQASNSQLAETNLKQKRKKSGFKVFGIVASDSNRVKTMSKEEKAAQIAENKAKFAAAHPDYIDPTSDEGIRNKYMGRFKGQTPMEKAIADNPTGIAAINQKHLMNIQQVKDINANLQHPISINPSQAVREQMNNLSTNTITTNSGAQKIEVDIKVSEDGVSHTVKDVNKAFNK